MKLIKYGTATTITLSDDLEWKDEFSWSATTSTHQYLLTGALLIQSSTKQAGRPITLSSPDSVWITRATLESLIAFTADSSQVYTLEFDAEEYVNEEEETIPGRTFKCKFDYTKNPIQADNVFFISPKSDQDCYKVTLNLIEVA